MLKTLTFIRHNAISLTALFVALGGTSYAAFSLPAGSVGTKQLRNGAVTSRKIANGSITPSKLSAHAIGGSVRHWASRKSGRQCSRWQPWRARVTRPSGSRLLRRAGAQVLPLVRGTLNSPADGRERAHRRQHREYEVNEPSARQRLDGRLRVAIRGGAVRRALGSTSRWFAEWRDAEVIAPWV